MTSLQPVGPSQKAEDAQDKTGQAPAADTAKKPSNAELKAQKQADKAKRRAAAVAAKEATSAPTAAAAAAQAQGAPPSEADSSKAGRPKAKHERSGSTNAAPAATAKPLPRRQSAGGPRPVAVVAAEKQKQEDARSTIPDYFSHLSMAKRMSFVQAEKDVHPAILVVGQQMAALFPAGQHRAA